MNDYIELHTHSTYSLLDGASPPQRLVERAFELGMPSLALTDHDAVYGAVTFREAAAKVGIHPIYGAELTLEGDHHLTLLAENSSGWKNLCRLITQARHQAEKGSALLPFSKLEGNTDGLIALSGCRQGMVSRAVLSSQWDRAFQTAQQLRDVFEPHHFYIELQHHLRQHDGHLVRHLVQLADHLQLPYVATNNVHYATPEQQPLQDVLVCIREHIPIDQASRLLRPNAEFFLKSAHEIAPLYANYPLALRNTLQIAERCTFELDYGLQELPDFPTPPGMNTVTYLQYLCDEGLLYKRLNESSKAVQQVAYELEVIERAGLANYFLIVWDIVRFARHQHIRCQGRGSAANSLIAYLLNISPINPLDHDLVFERFLSDERQIAPDIDIDFQADRREEVIQYVYSKYGHDHAAMACTLVTYRARSAIRDVGQALGLPNDFLERLAGVTDTYNAQHLAESWSVQEVLAEHKDAPIWKQFLQLCQQIDGFPRHLGIHNGGMVITRQPLAHRLPTEPATMSDRFVVQWDKDSLETAGLVKIDILGLRMLSAIAESMRWIEQQSGQQFDLSTLAFNDPLVFEMVSQADTVGVFQVESRAQAQVLPRLKPRTFADLIVTISLIRPGPVQGNMVHPYLRRRFGTEAVTYAHPILEPALAETLGVVLFQEQILKVAHDFAGFTPGQGEQLRRALGNKRAPEAIEAVAHTFYQGAAAQGVEPDAAGAVFDILRAFGGYSFPKSHAAAFAVLVYQSAWLKCYHPQAFYIGLLNHQPMGFWSPAVIVNDAKRHGIRALPITVNQSQAKCQPEGRNIRLGFIYVKGVSETTGLRISEGRQSGAFTSLVDFCKRTKLPKRVIEHLILAGAMDEWGKTRRQLIWQLGTLQYQVDELNLIFEEEEIELPEVSNMEAMGIEYAMLGLTLRDHVMSLHRAWLQMQGILDSQQLTTFKHGKRARVAGLMLIRQAPPTAKGFHFVTLEDEKGFFNVIVRPDIYDRYRRVLREAPVLMVEGIVQQSEEVTNLIAHTVSALRIG
jgi:error-prone DNA polymerase